MQAVTSQAETAMNLPSVNLTSLKERFSPSTALISNLLLLGLWSWLYHPVYPYLKTIFTREEFRFNQVVLLAILVLIVMQVRKGIFYLDFRRLPRRNRLAIGLLLSCSVIFLLSERFLEINTLSATVFGLASYGLLGLWMDAHRWRQGLPAALLLVSALPFGDHMQTFIGYPVRIFTAGAVQEGFRALGIPTITVDTILVFENGISQVDLPCSGVKSLWTGGIFLLAATWIERRPLNLRWFFAALVFVVLLLAANLARVAALVGVGQVAGWQLLAEMLHVPLGVIGFAAACAAVVWMLRRTSGPGQPEPLSADGKAGGDDRLMNTAVSHPRWLAPVLGAVLLVMVFIYTPRPESAAAQTIPTYHFPTALDVEPWPLTQGEANWLSSAGVEDAERWRFSWDDQTGSILLVSSTTWRAQHRPERCFEVYGLDIHNSHAYLVNQDFPVRLVSLGKGGKRVLYSAAYWFQSADISTDDYAVRIWSDLAPERTRWVLVTILFDEGMNPIDTSSLELYEALRQSLAHALQGVQP
jgi:exosortase O